MKNNNSTFQGDPSNIQQSFSKYNIQILCCRYWWLTHWEYSELSVPYWRLYYNGKEGASILYNNNKIAITPKHIYLIPPNTSYSSKLFHYPIPQSGCNLIGARITNANDFTDHKAIDHLFIHFDLQHSQISTNNNIFSFPITTEIESKIESIMNYLQTISAINFDFQITLHINSLVNLLLSKIELIEWCDSHNNNKILKTFNSIEGSLDKDLSNEKLAQSVYMATNSFIRLFKQEVGISPQRYIQKKRVDKACLLLHHSSDSIEEIASRVGFSNRYHFTRIFTQQTNISPSKYRKNFKYKSSPYL